MLPNFLVIGAAKAGTTALYWYLAEHPAVFMSPKKETNFFAYGRDSQGRLLYGDPEYHQFPIQTLAEYQQLFSGAGDAAARGEASPIYLECPQAAERIGAVLPEARLVCCLRHPVDRAYSDFQMDLRRRRRRLNPARDLRPGADWTRLESRWMQLGFYHGQLKRYYDRFPRQQIHVFLFDDLKCDPVKTVQGMYRFLGVAQAFTPDFDAPHNPGGLPESRLLEGIFTNPRLRSVVWPLVPRRAANWLRRLRTRNMRPAPSLPPELRRELSQQLRSEILSTSGLIGRNLDHWLR
jgi:sulfotransferase family protein